MQETQETQFNPRVGKIPWSRKWQPTPVFLPGNFHGQRSLGELQFMSFRVRHDWPRMHACTNTQRERGNYLWSLKSLEIQPLWRTVWKFLKRLGINLHMDPAIPLMGIYLEKIIIQNDTWTPVFIAALLICTTARTWKQLRCPWMEKKLWYMYKTQYYSAI